MDWIQVYLIVMITMSMTIALTKHEEPTKHNFWYSLLALGISAPYYGRVFGWW